MAYVPPWKRAGAQTPQQTLWTLAEIEDALPGAGSHTFVLAYEEDEERRNSRLIRIMRHDGAHLRNPDLPKGEEELWTRNHHGLLQDSQGLRLPLFTESPTSTGPSRGPQSKKLYEYSGYHTIDSVVIHPGGSFKVEGFVRKRDEGRKHHNEESLKKAIADPWACVRIRRCDRDVQQALGDPMARWVQGGRQARPRSAAPAVPRDGDAEHEATVIASE